MVPTQKSGASGISTFMEVEINQRDSEEDAQTNCRLDLPSEMSFNIL